MGKVDKMLAEVCTHRQVFLQNNKINTENSVNKISAINSPKNKELYVAKNYI